MVRSTIIARASDALPLAASSDDEEVNMSSHGLRALLHVKKTDVFVHFVPLVHFIRLSLHFMSTSNNQNLFFDV